MKKEILDHPLMIFAEWFEHAKKVEQGDATAAALATASKSAKPSVRIVLLKAFDERGFVFYTNLNSRKAKELMENPQAALCFFWQTADMQVRIEGNVERVSDQEANEYFATRPRGSQIGAWASKQSEPMQDPANMWERVKQYEERFHDQEVPRPEYWSGFRVVPVKMEFWRRGDHRLHERLCFYRGEENQWVKKYLYP